MNHAGGDLRSSNHYYDGEVYLCPPEQKPAGMQTTLGVVQLFLNGDTKSLSVKRPSDIAKHFGNTKVDSLCRQMGFSRAEHDVIYTQEALKHLHFSCNE